VFHELIRNVFGTLNQVNCYLSGLWLSSNFSTDVICEPILVAGWCILLNEREREPRLILVLALLVRITGPAHGLGLQEQDLGDPFPGVDLRGEGRRVRNLDGHAAPPLGFQRRHVHDDPAMRIRALADAHGDDVAGDFKVFDGFRERKAIRRNQPVLKRVIVDSLHRALRRASCNQLKTRLQADPATTGNPARPAGV